MVHSSDDSGVVAAGTVLAGRYRVGEVIGTGGMARVYRGEHAGFGRPVAIKVLRAALGSNQEAVTRFQREAIASGRLDHPNIVSVSDFGILNDGSAYLIMEALDGEHLGQRIDRERRIPWRDALGIMRSVLLGLRHAHDRGVVHRDVKPDNIFLARKGGEEVVKVLDFGIAKLYSGIADDLAATRTGITVGTPRYLSPEQAVGGAITRASDLYSASIVLYEMLVGRTPFDDADPLALLAAHVSGAVPALREVAPNVEVPEGLEGLVRRGLEKFSAERVGSALEYIQRVDEILRAGGVDVPAPARASRPMSIADASVPTPAPTARATPLSHILTPNPSLLAARDSALPPRVGRDEPSPRPVWAVIARHRVAVIAIALAVVVSVVVLSLLLARGDDSKGAASSPPQRAVPATEPPTRFGPEDDREVKFRAALRTLQDGATCAARRKAIATLVEVGDPEAIFAIKRARARGKANTCLRADAERAIKALSAK